jgi:Rod binding domain-containing protein
MKPFSEAISSLPFSSAPPARGSAPSSVKAAARELEAAFIAEMLSHAGFDKALTRDSGPAGESMTNFLVVELSQRLAARETFGIAALIERKLGNPS